MSSPPWPAGPVAVLGAGPVGQTTALLLARWGVPTVVLDQRLGHPNQRLRFRAKETGGVDLGLELFGRGARQGPCIRVILEQRRRHQVDPLVCRLR